MIITKTPFRISFCGGGSDLSSFYRENGGCVLSTSISKYMYISIHPYFYGDKILLKYSKTELVDCIDEIEHKILGCVLKDFNLRGIEITSMADIPAGTGLGSSSAFTVGLLNSLYCYTGKYVSKGRLADEACKIEIEKLGNPIGKQDQYCSSFGGLNFIRFRQDDSVSVEPIIMKQDTYQRLQNNLVLYYTGDVRSANTILSEQNLNILSKSKIANIKEMCNLAEKMKESLEANDISSFGNLLNENWLIKKTVANGISTSEIDHYYDIALANGALGGKLLGAGGGGFLLFYCEQEEQERLSKAMPLKQMKFSFEHDGTSVIFISDKYWD